MDQVKVVDAGAQLMLSGPSRALVEAALETLVARGAQVLSSPAQLGSRWIATCGKPPSGDLAAGPDVQASVDDALLRRVKIADTGDHVMITGEERSAVEAALAALARKGARILSAPAALGNGWVAACEKAETIANRCSVERMGFQFVIRGPNQAAVAATVRDLSARGAKQVGAIEHVGGEWVTVCDAGEVTGIMHLR